MERASVKNVAWEARKQFKTECAGYGGVVEVDDHTVAVPATWNIPTGAKINGHTFTRVGVEEVTPGNPKHRGLVSRLIKDAIKEQFKKQHSNALGTLWQDYNDFAEMPRHLSENEYYFCRRFQCDIKVLRGDLWAVRFVVNTTALDGWTVADYYSSGKVEQLAEIVLNKLDNQPARMNRPVAVRVWFDQRSNGGSGGRVFELHDPSQIVHHGKLSPAEQKRFQKLPLACQDFGKLITLDPAQCRMMLDTQTTTSDHDEAILDPVDRETVSRHLRDLANGSMISGVPLCLAENFISTNAFPSDGILPPAIHVQGERSTVVIPAPSHFSSGAILDRANRRKDHIRRYGFVESRPINPLLAHPSFLSDSDGQLIQDVLNRLLEEKGIAFRFERRVSYQSVEDIRRLVDDRGYDAILAILPESRKRAPRADDTHEQIKRRIPVPSQCMYHDTALPGHHRGKTFDEILRIDRKAANNIRNRLDLSLGNLLVKAHWFPFLPASPFHYNVHVGLDVGGKRNSEVMACIGYGFQKPQSGLFFRPEGIHMESRQAEPIPPEPLCSGLLQAFEEIHSELVKLGEVPDWSRVLFMRDGKLQGAGDEWNEIDALHKLFAEAKARRWIDDNAVWTAVEVMKAAEGWRVTEFTDQPENPTVGYFCQPFEGALEGLVCTTGKPYLPQGTAAPLKLKVVEINGRANLKNVAQDIVWEADMCYSKPDMGQSLPWTLHIADTGALQLARSYRISGITV